MTNNYLKLTNINLLVWLKYILYLSTKYMQHFLTYTKYNFFNLVRTKMFWVSALIYYVLLALFLFLLPYLTKINYLELFSYRSILSIINTALIMIAISVVLFLFKQTQEDGSELIIHSKPLSRTTMIWSKITIVFIVNVLIGLFAVALTSFVFINNKLDIYLTRAILLGAFVGPLITGLFWSGIAILAGFIFKKTTTFIIMLGLNGLFLIVSFVNVVSVVSQPQQAAKTGIDYYTTQFVNKNNHEISTYAIAINNDKAVVEDTTIDGVGLQQLGYTPQNILDKTWNEAYSSSNVSKHAYLDPAALFASFYSVYIDNWSWNTQNFSPVYKSFLKTETFFYTKFSSVNDDLFTSNSVFSNFLSSSKSTSVFLVDIGGNISGIDFNQETFSIPTPTFNEQTNNYNFQTFSVSNLTEFYETFFSQEQISLAANVQTKLNTAVNKNWGNNVANYYFMIFSSYLMTKENLTITNYVNNYQLNSQLKEYLINFQYYTYQLMCDYLDNPSKYTDVTANTINTWFSVLLQPENIQDFSDESLSKMLVNPKRTKRAIWQAKDNNNFVNNLTNFNVNQLNGIIVNNQTLPFTLITSANLASINKVQILPVYNYPVLIGTWIAASILIVIFAASIMYRTDVM